MKAFLIGFTACSLIGLSLAAVVLLGLDAEATRQANIKLRMWKLPALHQKHRTMEACTVNDAALVCEYHDRRGALQLAIVQ